MILRGMLISGFLAFWLSGFLLAGETGTADAKSAPQADLLICEKLESWLDRLEARSAKVETLESRIVYDKIQKLLGDKQRRLGKLIYEAGPPARFAVHFDKLMFDRRQEKQNRWYIFDGRWLVERLDDRKQFRKYEVVPPDAPPQAADPLALGEGPFAVPVQLNKKRLLKRFVVSLVEPETEEDSDEPENSVHLHLVPKDPSREVKAIDLWYHRETLLPLRAVTDNRSQEQHVIKLSKHKTDGKIKTKQFDTRAPSDRGQRGWLEEIKPWEDD